MGRPCHFLLLAQVPQGLASRQKVTKENGTPRGAVWAVPSQSVRGGRAFRPGSCPDEKCPTSRRAPLRGLIVHPSPPHRGLVTARTAARHIALKSRAARCRSAPSARPRRIYHLCGRALGALLLGKTPLFVLAFDVRAPMPRAGGRWNSPQGGQHGCRPVDRQGRTPCRSTPPPVCDPVGARHRGGLSLGYFSLLRASRPPPFGPASPFARAPARAWPRKEK